MTIVRMTLVSVVAALPALTAQYAFAAMDMETMSKASGLAKIIASAEHCGYTVNDEALASYFETKKLDDPETFDFIQNSITVQKMQDKPNSSACTMAKRSGTKIGIIK